MLTTAVGYPYELAHRQLFTIVMSLDLDTSDFDALPDPDVTAINQPLDEDHQHVLAQLVQSAHNLIQASRTSASAAEKVSLAARFCKLQY